jgi:hypothetical protein
LALFAGTFPTCADGVFPDASSIQTALTTTNPALSLPAALNAATAAGCPKISQGEWICLANFNATLTTASGSASTVTDISAPDNTITDRHTLLSTAALQEIVLGIVDASDPQGLLAGGPTLGTLSFTGNGPDSGVLVIPVNLITDPTQTNPTALAAGTFESQYLEVFKLDQTNWNWAAPTATPGTVAYDPTQSQFTVTWPAGSGLAKGNFRVSLISPDDQPIVDQRMRPLKPARFTQNFGLAQDTNNNNLIWAPVSF